MESPTFAKLSSMHFYGWQRGLKTGMYYLRSKAATDPIKFTLASKHLRISGVKTEEGAPVALEMATAAEAAKLVLAEKMMSRPVAVADIVLEETMMDTPNMFSDEPIPAGKICSIDDPDCEACSA